MPTSSPVPGFPTCFAAYSRFSGKNGHHRAGGGRELWNPMGAEWWRLPTSSPVPGLPTCFVAYSRFPGRNGRHRAGIGREPWNPMGQSGGVPLRHWGAATWSTIALSSGKTFPSAPGEQHCGMLEATRSICPANAQRIRAGDMACADSVQKRSES